MKQPKAFAIVGWKNSGKSTLVAKLISHFSASGFKVGAIKHAHHAFEIDHAGTDSHRHRLAGAQKVVLASSKRIAEIEEFVDETPVNLTALLARFGGYDLIICEGFKRGDIPKIEIIAPDTKGPFLHESDSTILGIASDQKITTNLPCFARDDVADLAKLAAERLGIL